MAEPLLTTTETARALAVSPQTVRRLVARGELRPVRLGERLIRFRAEEIQKILRPCSKEEVGN